MSTLPTIAILGAGSMGGAILNGLLSPSVTVEGGIRVTNRTEAKAAPLRSDAVTSFALENDPGVDRIRDEYVQPRLGLLAAVRKDSREIISYCGLIANAHGQDHEPELAYEFLRREWGRGLATEAASAVLQWAESLGYTRLWATIRDWNTASRQVASKLGFVVTSRIEPNAEHSDSLLYRKDLEPGR